MTEDQIKHMVDRFLGWKLPENFNPDGGVSFKRLENRHHHAGASPFYPMPTGTNVLDATQATAMVRYMIEGMPAAPADGVTSAELIAALRAFPHFEGDTPVTPDAICAVAKEYINMVMTWEPQRAALEFLDHAGNQHWLVYEAGDGDLAGGWTLRDDSNLAARSDTAEARLREALNEVVTNGEWTEGEQRGEWKISKDVYDLAIEARDKALSPPSGGDEAKESEGLCTVPPGKNEPVTTQTACDEGESNDSATARRMSGSESTGSLASVIATTQREDRASPGTSEHNPTHGCKRAGGFVDSGCTAICDCHETQKLSRPSEPSPPADRREIVVRIKRMADVMRSAHAQGVSMPIWTDDLRAIDDALTALGGGR